MSGSTRALMAELIGSFVLLFLGGLSIIAGQGDLVVLAFGFGLALFAGLYAFGEVSGGHYNPAVSLAMLIDKRIDSSQFVQYVIAQAGGAVLAGVALLAASSKATVAGTATRIGPGVSTGAAFFLELIGTAIFVAVILKVTRSDGNTTTVMLAIALTLVGIHLAMAPLSGASVNPARSLGSALVGNTWSDFWIYIVGPGFGAGFGWVLYRLTDSGDFSR